MLRLLLTLKFLLEKFRSIYLELNFIVIHRQVRKRERRAEIITKFHIMVHFNIHAEDTFRLLGAAILDKSVPAFINYQIAKFNQISEHLSQINHHIVLFIIRFCLFVPKFIYVVVRCLYLWKFESLLSSVHDLIRDTLINILNCPFNCRSSLQPSVD